MLMDRIMGVFRLNPATFEEVEHDRTATGQAALVVAIVAILAAIGAGFAAQLAGASFIANFISALIWTFLGWLVWAAISFFVGTTLFNGKATLDEMLRVIGFAYAPQMLAIIPCIGGLIGAIWSLIAGFIAVRQGLDLDNTRALLTILVGFVVYIIGSILINVLVGGAAALLGQTG